MREKSGMMAISARERSEEEKQGVRERTKRTLQLFVQLLSSGCAFTGVCVCVHVNHVSVHDLYFSSSTQT